MARINPDDAVVNARIVYWGIEGSGKTTNLQTIYRKLRPDHRGELESLPTRIDPTVHYEVLPIELGEIAGLRTRIQMVAVPGSADQAPTRKQLLDQVDGVVLVIDSQADRIEENTASLAELRAALSDYGRSLEDVPLVIQCNKRDLSDPFTLEELYRRLDVGGAAVFEAVATETTGVLQTLSTLSKHVIRTLRGQQFDVESQREAAPEPAPVAPPPVEQPTPIEPETDDFDHAPPTVIDFGPADAPLPEAAADRMEAAILAEGEHPESDDIDSLASSAQNLLDAPWEQASDEFDAMPSSADFDAISGADESDPMAEPIPAGPTPSPSQPMNTPKGPQLSPELSVESVGEATRSGERGVRVPLVVADKDGRRATLVLNISLDALLDEDTG
jgi:hypothetical protein